MKDGNGRWRWLAGATLAVLFLLGGGLGSFARATYENHETRLDDQAVAVGKLILMVEQVQDGLERIERRLEEMQSCP